MSTSSPDAVRLQSPSPSLPDLTELAALAEKLQEAVKSLLVFCRQARQAESPGVEFDGQYADEGTEQEKGPGNPHETRCYRIPGNILDEEREMLTFYKAEDWQELFNKAHDQIYATVLLMERIPAEEEIDGFSITLIAESLMMPLRMLGKLCSLIADFRLVSVMKVPA